MSPRTSESLLQDLARQVPGMIFQFRRYPDGRDCFPYASESMREIYEVAPEDARDDAAAVFARVHPDDLLAKEESIRESVRTLGEWRWTYRVLLPQRGLRWLSGRARPERLPDGSTLWHGYIEDVTTQRREGQELARIRAGIDNSLTGFATTGADGTIDYVNRAALETWGLSDASQALGRPLSDFWVSNADFGSLVEQVRREGSGAGVLTARHADGGERRIQVRTNAIPGPLGRPLGLIASLMDITDAEATAHALKVRDQALMTARNALVIADTEGRLIFVNPAFVSMWGYADVSEVEGKHALSFADPVTTARVLETLAREGAWEGELVANRQDGTPFDIRVSANVVRGDDGQVRYLMASVADITDAKRMELQLRQSQKMQTVGRLAGGVAHDFNNLLTVMKGYLGLVREQLAPDSPLDADLAEVERAANSAAMLTQRLLAFSRRQPVAPQVLDLDASVAHLRAMLERVIGEDIELSVTSAPGLDRVRFDPNQMEQVLMNLAVNARDAMPSGGRLELVTSNLRVERDPPHPFPAVPPGDFVHLVVRDTGHGMSPEVQAQIFEPFFTTKPPGHGTGLGLAMVYGAVSQNDGYVAVESAPDRGTAFHVLLPAVGEAPSARPSPNESSMPAGSEAVLVVEDEPAIRTLAARMLGRQGYRVRACATGPEAIALLQDSDEPVDLVVTDVIMPEMHGSALAEELRRMRPGVRVLFVSGYTEEVIGRHGVMEAGVDFLAKPYSVMTLARRVREALDRPAER